MTTYCRSAPSPRSPNIMSIHRGGGGGGRGESGYFFDDPEMRLKHVTSPIPAMPLLRSYISADGGVGCGGGGTTGVLLHASDCPVALTAAASPVLLFEAGGDADGVDDVSIVTSGSRLSYSSEELPERDDPVNVHK